MNDGIVLFDTDFISEYVRDKPDAVAFLNHTPPECCFTTIVSEAELIAPRYRQLLTAANEVELMKAQLHLNQVRDVLTNAFAGILPMDLKDNDISRVAPPSPPAFRLPPYLPPRNKGRDGDSALLVCSVEHYWLLTTAK